MYNTIVGTHKITPLLSLKPDEVEYYYQTLYASDTLKYRFSDIDNPAWLDVLEVIQRFGRQMYFSTNDDNEILADFMLENFTGQSAQMHFSFLPSLPTSDKLLIARKTMHDIFHNWKNPNTNEPFLKSVYGLTPAPNRAACLFALRAGFKKLGILPSGVRYMGNNVDAMVSVATPKQTKNTETI